MNTAYPKKTVNATIAKNDKRRAKFYNAQSTKKWDGMDTYDLCLNSSTLGIDTLWN